MNTANLQLEGLYLAIAAMHEMLISKGTVSRQEVDAAMRAAERTAMNDDRSGDLRPAERDALAFPARLLRLANATVSENGAQSFSALARGVGSSKLPYHDQR
ncbi:hypothetical protein PRN20_20170 [Devosia sp. ZB163]|uniref:hypothetical protein n=1 Tax=Devosia sp. ZB163 TaxID=3025938 RepID=UPI002361E4BB|nr:hypothetical protein [Devosia sp. ZB163]MDC9826059.1 hypothetical protein [Devosia sp. ZB163]